MENSGHFGPLPNTFKYLYLTSNTKYFQSICIWPQIPNTQSCQILFQILVKYFFEKNLSFSSLCTQLSILPWKSCMESQQRSKNAKTCTTIKYDSRCLKMNNLTDWRLLGRSKVRDYTFYIKTSQLNAPKSQGGFYLFGRNLFSLNLALCLHLLNGKNGNLVRPGPRSDLPVKK